MQNLLHLQGLLGIYADEYLFPAVDDMCDELTAGDLVAFTTSKGERQGFVTGVNDETCIVIVEHVLTDRYGLPYVVRSEFEAGQLTLLLKQAAQF